MSRENSAIVETFRKAVLTATQRWAADEKSLRPLWEYVLDELVAVGMIRL